MVNCKDCMRSELGKEGRVCYLRVIQNKDKHVKDDDNCKDAIQKPIQQVNKPVEQPKEDNKPIAPKIEGKATTEPKAENKQEDEQEEHSTTVK